MTSGTTSDLPASISQPSHVAAAAAEFLAATAGSSIVSGSSISSAMPLRRAGARRARRVPQLATAATAGGSSRIFVTERASPAAHCTRSRCSPRSPRRRHPHAAALCDWLQAVAFADGGLPFAMPVETTSPQRPFWVGADHAHSSLHITTAVTAMGHRVAKADPAVRAHPWLAASTAYCLDTIASRDRAEHTLELMYSLWFLDEVADSVPEAADHIRRLGAAVPADGLLHVEGGLDDEFIRPLDVAPFPATPVRSLFADRDIDRELERLGVRPTGRRRLARGVRQLLADRGARVARLPHRPCGDGARGEHLTDAPKRGNKSDGFRGVRSCNRRRCAADSLCCVHKRRPPLMDNHQRR